MARTSRQREARIPVAGGIPDYLAWSRARRKKCPDHRAAHRFPHDETSAGPPHQVRAFSDCRAAEMSQHPTMISGLSFPMEIGTKVGALGPASLAGEARLDVG